MKHITDALTHGAPLYLVTRYVKALGDYRHLVTTPNLAEASQIAADEGGTVIEITARIVTDSIAKH